MGKIREERPKIWYDYMKWLIKQVRFDKKRYYKLIKHLHDIPFEVSSEVPMDENRAGDGTYQRNYFFREMGLVDADFPYPCSMLEFLVAFTIRMGDNYVGYDERDWESHYEWIFWAFLCNLGLDIYDDSDYFEEGIDEKVGVFVLREYKNDGLGSIFPLKRSYPGYNLMEIWKQMNIFLEQNRVENVSFFEKFW